MEYAGKAATAAISKFAALRCESHPVHSRVDKISLSFFKNHIRCNPLHVCCICARASHSAAAVTLVCRFA
ncbi:hypothetical protein EVAR_48062_1 [Eumeta japonica]|uniref:Uncharacterized protein n=1 Tax=Eumeta variegata TaxID=151549 RepID=A0A4C1X5N9_EUMVA|nr:hypothetical protein EVAR_48062_1 [Eumeta japonica]